MLQPRVTPSLPVGREGSLFQRVFSSPSGIDPYAVAVSDVYQDLFGEGSYAGKGIYDVDAFEAALADRVPDSTLLSHDLFEGMFARAGLASDVEVVEEFPARYDVAALAPPSLGARRLAAAAVDFRPRPCDRRSGGRRGAIPAIGRWKMLDNLRRTLSAPAAVLALLAGLDAAASTRLRSGPPSCSPPSRCRRCFRSSPAIVPRRPGRLAAQPSRRARRRSAPGARRNRRC